MPKGNDVAYFRQQKIAVVGTPNGMKLCNTFFSQIQRSKDHIIEAGVLGAGRNKRQADAGADQ